MTRRSFVLSTLNPKLLLIGGSFTIGAAGAVSSEDGAKLAGGTVTQTGSEDGRYAIAFDRTYKRLVTCGAQMVGPDDDPFPTTTGSDPQLRLKTTSGFTVQFKAPDAQDDVDPAEGTVCTWWALVALA